MSLLPAGSARQGAAPEQWVMRLAEKCADAYSTDRYTRWDPVIRTLWRAGLDEREIEAVIRSKWTRWAADHNDNKRAEEHRKALPWGQAQATPVLEFVYAQGQDALNDLVLETFSGTAVSQQSCHAERVDGEITSKEYKLRVRLARCVDMLKRMRDDEPWTTREIEQLLTDCEDALK